MELIFKCGNDTSLSELVVRKNFRILLELFAFLASNDQSESLNLYYVNSKLTIIFSQKYHSTTLCLSYLTVIFLCLNGFS